MKEITLKKVTHAELDVLQSELLAYSQQQALGLGYWSTEEFLNALTAIDISTRLWFLLRKKLEMEGTYFSVKLKISDAVILFRCCTWQRSARTEYQKLITGKFQRFIDQKLISIPHTLE